MLTEVRGGSSLRRPMAYEAFLALGETKHHEYYDGLCVVNPPSRRHVTVTRRLTRILEDACPTGYGVYPEWGWHCGPREDFEPDVIVAAHDAPADDQLRVPPLLVVEVTSASTRADDWGRKRDAYGRGGAAWYWIVDRGPDELVVWRNVERSLVEVRRFGAGCAVNLAEPFPVAIDLGLLFAESRPSRHGA